MTFYRRMNAAIPMGRMSQYSRSTARQRIADRMNPRLWALSFVGAVLAKTDYKQSHNPFYAAVVVTDIAGNGRYVKVQTLSDDGTPGMFFKPKWVLSNAYYRAFDSLELFKLDLQIRALKDQLTAASTLVDRQREADLSLLSRNTVTRALVHASSNDYCSETAVALISAGHKMPDVTLSLRVTFDVTVELDGNDNYYPLRALFGATHGEVDGASGIDAVERSDKVRNAVMEQIQSGDVYIGYDDVTHTGTEVTWHAPLLRPVANNVAYNMVNHDGSDD